MIAPAKKKRHDEDDEHLIGDIIGDKISESFKSMWKKITSIKKNAVAIPVSNV